LLSKVNGDYKTKCLELACTLAADRDVDDLREVPLDAVRLMMTKACGRYLCGIHGVVNGDFVQERSGGSRMRFAIGETDDQWTIVGASDRRLDAGCGVVRRLPPSALSQHHDRHLYRPVRRAQVVLRTPFLIFRICEHSFRSEASTNEHSAKIFSMAKDCLLRCLSDSDSGLKFVSSLLVLFVRYRTYVADRRCATSGRTKAVYPAI
jgi:hypothetical protein